MRAVVQRVKSASCKVDNEIVGKIDKGLLLFLGVGEGDEEKDLKYLVDKVLGLRIFSDENGKMNLSLEDVKGEILIISQFTLYGDVRKGKRPSFTRSAAPELGEKFYEMFIEMVNSRGIQAQTGVYGADMDIELINDGPVTILVDSEKTF